MEQQAFDRENSYKIFGLRQEETRISLSRLNRYKEKILRKIGAEHEDYDRIRQSLEAAARIILDNEAVLSVYESGELYLHSGTVKRSYNSPRIEAAVTMPQQQVDQVEGAKQQAQQPQNLEQAQAQQVVAPAVSEEAQVQVVAERAQHSPPDDAACSSYKSRIEEIIGYRYVKKGDSKQVFFKIKWAGYKLVESMITLDEVKSKGLEALKNYIDELAKVKPKSALFLIKREPSLCCFLKE